MWNGSHERQEVGEGAKQRFGFWSWSLEQEVTEAGKETFSSVLLKLISLNYGGQIGGDESREGGREEAVPLAQTRANGSLDPLVHPWNKQKHI